MRDPEPIHDRGKCVYCDGLRNGSLTDRARRIEAKEVHDAAMLQTLWLDELDFEEPK